MKKYAQVVNGVVENISESEVAVTAPGHVELDSVQDAEIGIGDLYDGAVFSKSPKAPAKIAREFERVAISAIHSDAALSAIYNTLKTASFAQIATWVDNNFGGMTVTQRAALTLIIANTAADLRERENR